MRKRMIGMKKAVSSMKTAVMVKSLQARAKMKENTGEGYIDTAVKILIAVVLGALLLAGLYTLFGDLVMPTLTRRIQEMFNYAG